MITSQWETNFLNFRNLYWFLWCKEHPYPLNPSWGFRNFWKFLIGAWRLDNDLDMVTSLWYSHVLNFGCLCWFIRCKEHLCNLSPDLCFGGCWSFLNGVWHLDHDLALVTGLLCSSVPDLSYLYWFCKEHQLLQILIGGLEDAAGSWLGIVILIIIWGCSGV